MTRAELRALPLFAGVSEACLDRVSATCGELEAPAGAVLALTGDIGSGMFVLLEGRERPGEFFGELPLLVPDAGRVGRATS
jgi:CRP-like cAMP-binding protein